MASFTISIELRDDTESAYQNLNNIMRSYGFKHSVSDDDGVHYRLLRGEFTCSGYLCRQEILDRVFNATLKILPYPKVLVTEAAGRAWRGLEKIDFP